MNNVNTNETELERFQKIKSKVDDYNTKVLEKELKLKQLQEDKAKLEEELKQLGYNSLDEAESAYKELSKNIDDTLSKMEESLNANS